MGKEISRCTLAYKEINKDRDTKNKIRNENKRCSKVESNDHVSVSTCIVHHGVVGT